MIVNTTPSQDTANQGSIIIRALSSITLQQADTITQAVRASGQRWIVETFDDYDGYLSILLEPSVDDDRHPAFFIAGTAQHLELFEAHDDKVLPIASFSEVDQLSARLSSLIGY